ncbi:MAG: peptidylprolyl isomerase [Bacteroidota bacterium]
MLHQFRLRRAAAAGPAVACALLLAGCSPREHDAVVATVGNGAITLPEYETHYLKSLGTRAAGASTSMDERKKFLDLLVKYRLKLAEAYREGLDKTPEVLSELEMYKGSLAQSFLTEREVVAPGLRTLYARRNEEVRASHILISLSQEASPTDSALAFAKAYKVTQELRGGRDFASAALEYSQDPGVSQSKGDLYYFTAGLMVPPFEDAVFAMKPGEISDKPVRTMYGLHVIKVTDRRIAPGEIRAAHIMIRFPQAQPTPEDTLAAYQKIRAIQDSLHAGVDFAGLARRHSEDPGSAARGGDLGFFNRRRWVQPFDEVAFTLAPGQISDIVRTVYGYHLIHCEEVRPRKTFEESKAELQSIYQQTRFQQDYAIYVGRLKRQMHFVRDDSVYGKLLASVDSNRVVRDSSWGTGQTPGLERLILFRMQDGPVTVDSVIAMLKARADLQSTSLRAATLGPAIEKIGEQIVFAAKADRLQHEIPEFASLMKEYREGILLYQVEQENVWNRVALSDSVLKRYFEAHRDKFSWPDRIRYTQIRVMSDSLARVVHGMLLSGKSIAQVAEEDSVRMAAPLNHHVEFVRSSLSLNKETREALAAVAAEMKRDRALRLTVTARPDTFIAAAREMKAAGVRLHAVVRYLSRTLGLDMSRIVTSTFPVPHRRATDSLAPNESTPPAVDVYLSGRLPLIAGKPETLLNPSSTDERSRMADSLQAGAFSKPFPFAGAYTITQLLAREPARLKTFEEAGPELSSAYQDYESKRLEEEWINRLRREFPVVEHTAALSSAFANSTH